ncbi:hypothetical protein V6N13_042586 [Hibiscus sabdariffa]
MVVVDLIDQTDKVWNPEILQELFDEYQAARICSILLARGPSVLSRWEAPPYPAIKVNFDFVSNQQNSSATYGAIGRSSEGLILATCAIPHNNVHDAFVAEAVACQQEI